MDTRCHSSKASNIRKVDVILILSGKGVLCIGAVPFGTELTRSNLYLHSADSQKREHGLERAKFETTVNLIQISFRFRR